MAPQVVTAAEAGVGNVQLETGAAPQMNVRADPAAFGAVQADELGQLSRAIGQAGELADHVVTRNSVIAARHKAVDGALEWHDRAQQMEQEAPPGAPGFGKSVRDEFTKWKQDQLAGAANDVERDALGQQLDELQASTFERADGFEYKAQQAHVEDQLAQTVDKSRTIVLLNPDALGDQLKGQLGLIQNSSLSPQLKDRLARDQTNMLTAAHWEGRSEADPRGTLAQLKTDDVPGLGYADRARLLSRTQERVNTLDVEARRQEAEAHRQAHERLVEQRAGRAIQQAQQQSDIKDRLGDELAQLRDGVPGATTLVTDKEVAEAFGPKRAPAMLQSLQRQRAVASAVGSIAGKPVDEQQRILAGLQPQAGPGYGEASAGFAAAQEAFAHDQAERAADPVAYVVRHDPAAAKLHAAAMPGEDGAPPDPAALAHAATYTLARQLELGIPAGQAQLLTKRQASAVVGAFKGAQTTEQRLAAIAPLTLGMRNDDGTTSDALARKALDQLEAAGLPEGADRALEAYRQGEPERAHAMLGALTVDGRNLPDPGETKARDIDKAVADLYAEPGGNLAVAEATTWAATGQPGNATQATRGRAMLDRVARQEGAKPGVDAQTAVRNAYRIVYGDGKVTGDPAVGIVRVPDGADPAAFGHGLEGLRAGVDLLSHLAPTREGVAALLRNHLGRDPEPSLVERAFYQATRDHPGWEADVRENARFVGAPGGYQLVLPTGKAVPGPDGRARIFTPAEVGAAVATWRGSSDPNVRPPALEDWMSRQSLFSGGGPGRAAPASPAGGVSSPPMDPLDPPGGILGTGP